MGYASFFTQDIRPIINKEQGEFMFEFIKKLFGLGKVEADVAVVEEQAKKVVRRVKKVVDINNDNVINLDDVKEVKQRVTKKVKEAADINKDGRVDVEDLIEVLKKATKKPTPSSSVIKQEIVEPIKPQPKVSTKKRGRKPKPKSK